MISNYSRVRLLTNRYAAQGAPQGSIGNVIEVYGHGNYEVEFSDKEGIDYAQLVAREEELHVEGPDEEPDQEAACRSAAPSSTATIGA